MPEDDAQPARPGPLTEAELAAAIDQYVRQRLDKTTPPSEEVLEQVYLLMEPPQ